MEFVRICLIYTSYVYKSERIVKISTKNFHIDQTFSILTNDFQEL